MSLPDSHETVELMSRFEITDVALTLLVDFHENDGRGQCTPPASFGHCTELVESPSCDSSDAVRLSAGVSVMCIHASMVLLEGGPGNAINP